MYLFERTQIGDKVEFRHPGGFFFSFIISPGTTEDLYLEAIGNCGGWTRLPQLLDRSITADEWKEYREEIDLRWPPCNLAEGNMEPKFFDDARKTIDRIHNAPFDCGEIRADGVWVIETKAPIPPKLAFAHCQGEGPTCLFCKDRYACTAERNPNPFKVGDMVKVNLGEGSKITKVVGLSRNAYGMPFVDFIIDRGYGLVHHSWSTNPEYNMVEKVEP